MLVIIIYFFWNSKNIKMRILDFFSKREHAFKNWDIILKEQAPYIKQNKINATKEAETKGLIWLKKGKEVDLKKKQFWWKKF